MRTVKMSTADRNGILAVWGDNFQTKKKTIGLSGIWNLPLKSLRNQTKLTDLIILENVKKKAKRKYDKKPNNNNTVERLSWRENMNVPKNGDYIN